jgi:hypothetical protein
VLGCRHAEKRRRRAVYDSYAYRAEDAEKIDYHGTPPQRPRILPIFLRTSGLRIQRGPIAIVFAAIHNPAAETAVLRFAAVALAPWQQVLARY